MGDKSVGLENEVQFGDDPILEFSKLRERMYDLDPEACDTTILATASREGLPNARAVLLKKYGASGFRFFTNYQSSKAHDLNDNPQACLVFWWAPLNIQIRVNGPVTKISAQESDQYFASRPRESQLSAWASPQSQPITDRDSLENRWNEISSRFEDQTIPRPPFWGGYDLTPKNIEFMIRRKFRLHDRYLYTKQSDGRWVRSRLGA